MRIGVFTDFFPPNVVGGAEISAYELVEEYVGLGHSVVVFTSVQDSKYQGMKHYLFGESIVTVYKIFSNYNSRWRHYKAIRNSKFLLQLKEILNNQNLDIAHCQNIHTHVSFKVIELLRRAQIPSVITLRDCLAFANGPYHDHLMRQNNIYYETNKYKFSLLREIFRYKIRFNPLKRFLARRFLEAFNYRVAISHELKQALEFNHIKDVKVIMNGINISKYALRTSDEIRSIRRVKTIFWCGRITKRKGILELLRAFSEVDKTKYNVVLKIAAKMDEIACRYIQNVVKPELKENVEFVGWLDRDELKNTIRDSDLIVYPSTYLEPFGRLPIEAMAMRKPVIVSGFGGLKEIIQPDVSGIIVNPFDTKAFAHAIEKCISNQKFSDALGQNGYLRVKKYFSNRDVAGAYIKLFQNLLYRIKYDNENL